MMGLGEAGAPTAVLLFHRRPHLCSSPLRPLGPPAPCRTEPARSPLSGPFAHAQGGHSGPPANQRARQGLSGGPQLQVPGHPGALWALHGPGALPCPHQALDSGHLALETSRWVRFSPQPSVTHRHGTQVYLSPPKGQDLDGPCLSPGPRAQLDRRPQGPPGGPRAPVCGAFPGPTGDSVRQAAVLPSPRGARFHDMCHFAGIHGIQLFSPRASHQNQHEVVANEKKLKNCK